MDQILFMICTFLGQHARVYRHQINRIRSRVSFSMVNFSICVPHWSGWCARPMFAKTAQEVNVEELPPFQILTWMSLPCGRPQKQFPGSGEKSGFKCPGIFFLVITTASAPWGKPFWKHQRSLERVMPIATCPNSLRLCTLAKAARGWTLTSHQFVWPQVMTRYAGEQRCTWPQCWDAIANSGCVSWISTVDPVDLSSTFVLRDVSVWKSRFPPITSFEDLQGEANKKSVFLLVMARWV